jgi:predicted TIM-barrel fold metal-dependent hydrolase
LRARDYTTFNPFEPLPFSETQGQTKRFLILFENARFFHSGRRYSEWGKLPACPWFPGVMENRQKLTRRDFLVTAAAAGVALSARIASAKASQPATAVNFAVPPGACDCHTHIIGDPATFPFAADRVYTPETASPEEMSALHRALHIQRVVIVTPSFYGTDNSATLYGMKARGGNARGVAVIDERTGESELTTMDRAGITGVRINLATVGQTDPIVARRRFQSSIHRIRHLGWHIQMNTNLNVISGLKDLVAASPLPVVFDHFGGAEAALGVAQAGWGDLVDLVRSGRVYVKLSAEYSISAHPPDYPDVAAFAKALVAANPDRILWGSDWPHTNSKSPRARSIAEITPFTTFDDGRMLNQFALWIADAKLRKKILVDNPARLYRF